MRILIVCPTTFYNKIGDIKLELENLGHSVYTPNCYDDPITNEDSYNMNDEDYVLFFKKMYNDSRNAIKNVDAILVLNFDKVKNGTNYCNYIGASTFLEMYEACIQNKKIYLYNGLPDSNNILLDEIKGFGPVLINKDLSIIK